MRCCYCHIDMDSGSPHAPTCWGVASAKFLKQVGATFIPLEKEPIVSATVPKHSGVGAAFMVQVRGTPLTMSIIDDLRAGLEKARDERKNRDRVASIHEQDLAYARERDAETAVLAALRQWWKQDCREIPDEGVGCPCGKVAVKPGEDPLVRWCAAGHPLTMDGKIDIPFQE